RGLPTSSRQDGALLVDDTAGDLRAAHVDPDSQTHQSSSHSSSLRSIFSTPPSARSLEGSGVWVASRPAAACIRDVAAVVRCWRTSGLVPRTAAITRQTGQ